ncbi:hypothetical protein [Mycobacterium avium]|uniref:hypothetical protein n=1 Tax=Mycobacterium avium TaxID=1764 RepID=UPI000AADC859|nr:hypothetical protein [Mycobacterium avium]
MASRAEMSSAMIDKLLDAIYRWEDKVNAFTATGDPDDDIVLTHDGRGRLIGCDIRPGLQEELTVGELEEAMNDAIARNAARTHAGIQAMAAEFREEFAHIPEEFAQHPVAVEFAAALRGAG